MLNRVCAEDLREELGDALYGLTAVIVRAAPRGLSLTVMSLLSTLERNGPQRVTALAKSQGISQPTATALVSRLAELVLIQRRADPTDGRVVLVVLTDAGAAYLAEQRRLGCEAVVELLAGFSDAEVELLSAALPAIKRIRDCESLKLRREPVAQEQS